MEIPNRFISATSLIKVPASGKQAEKFPEGVPLSLLHLAQELDLDESYLHRVFKGQRMPSYRFTRKVAFRLKMNVSTLYDYLQSKYRMRDQWAREDAEEDRQYPEPPLP